jgi:hypothetical protein
MCKGEAIVFDVHQPRGDDETIGIKQRLAKASLHALQNETNVHAAAIDLGGHEAKLVKAQGMNVRDARGLQVAKVDNVIDVSECVHFSPLDGELDGGLGSSEDGVDIRALDIGLHGSENSHWSHGLLRQAML